MAVTIDVSGANTYFAATNHVNADLWLSFSDNQHTAAIAHAKRQIERALGSTITSETVQTDADYQPDYACYEQALYLLLNSAAIPDGTQTGPKYFGNDGNDQERMRKPLHTICEEAKRWMDWQAGSSVAVMRGG